MMREAVLELNLPGVLLFKRGKVREVYTLGDYLLVVASDRISAFDVIMPNGIPWKGEVLTSMSAFWFRRLAKIIPNHLVSVELPQVAALTGIELPLAELLEGRSMLVRRTEPFPMECVVRGYLAGSGWKEYQAKGTLAGVRLPGGMRESERLPEPLFTPSTKAESGHDVNLTQDEARALVGEAAYERLAVASTALYRDAAAYAETRGIIIADTKFEFGEASGETLLIDEALTPDSSRFWPMEGYAPGQSQPSFDKQFVRDWLESSGWDKNPPAPQLPPDVVRQTAEKYLEAHALLVGFDF